jgi:hypothetical protein
MPKSRTRRRQGPAPGPQQKRVPLGSKDYANKYLEPFINENKQTICFYVDRANRAHVSITGLGDDEFILLAEAFIECPELKNLFRSAIEAADGFGEIDN